MGKLAQWLKLAPEPVQRSVADVEQAYLEYARAYLEEVYGLEGEAVDELMPGRYALERHGATSSGVLWCAYDTEYYLTYVFILDTGDAAEVFLAKSKDGDVIARDDVAEVLDPEELKADVKSAAVKWCERGAAVEKRYTVLKADDEQRYTLGVAYPAGEVDSHGDFTDATELERAAWDFMTSGAIMKAGAGTDHADGTDLSGQPVESYIYRGPDWEIGEQVIEAGDWLLGVVWSEKAWSRITAGELTGYSIQGYALRDDTVEGPDDGGAE